MKTMGIREFRAALSTSLSEPIQVLGHGAEVGVYYPLKDDSIAQELAALQEEVGRLKRELAARTNVPTFPGFNTRPFTPAPKKRK